MRTITAKVITDILDEMGVSYSIIKPRTGGFGYRDTMFMIKDKTNLLYLTNFNLKVDSTTYEISSADMFFLTPCGELSSEWVRLGESDFIKSDYDDVFIITTNDEFEFTDLDDEIRAYMGLSDSDVKTLTYLEDKTVESGERPLSEFLKSKIEIL